MADITANYHVEQQRLRWQVAQQEAEIERFRFAVLEQADKKARALANIVAAEAAVKENTGQLEALPGDASPIERQKLRTAIAGQAAKIEERRLDIFRIPEAAVKAQDSEGAAREAVAKFKAALEDMEQAHGALTSKLYNEMRASALMEADTNG